MKYDNKQMDKNFRFFKGQNEVKEQKLQLKDFLYEKNIDKILDKDENLSRMQ